MMSDLFSPHALDSLPHYEAVIERGLKTFCEVGEALLAIRDGRLYRENHSTFEDYCTSRWGMSRPYAYNLMDAAGVVTNLRMSAMADILPTSERQARPLAALLPDEQVEAWKAVIDAAGDNKITAGQVQQVVFGIVSGREKRDIDPAFTPSYDRTIELPPGVTEKDASTVLSALALASQKAGPGRIEKAVKVLAGATTNIHVSDDSYEWYTPAEYLQAARSVMGGIDLDPASSHHAQEMVQAGAFFSRADDGLAQEWRGTVWLNPPYSSPEVDNFMDKLVQEYQSGHVSEAIALTNNSTDTRWFHRAASASSAMCFTKGRIGFWKPEAAPLAARQGQVFFYMGDRPERFAPLFAPFGLVVLPYPAA